MGFLGYRITLQTIVNLMWIVKGVLAQMIGVSLLDLRTQLGVDYEGLALGLGIQSLGLLIGAVCGGMLHEKFVKLSEFFTAGGLILMGICHIVTPHLPTLTLFCLIMLITGFGKGFLNTGGNPLVMRLWDERAAPALHSLHFGYGLGCVIAAEMTRPFLAKIQPTNLTMGEVNSVKFSNYSENLIRNLSGLMSPSHLEYPFTISGALAILIGCLLIVIHIRGPPMGFPARPPPDGLRSAASLRSCSIGKECYGAITLVLCFSYFLFTQGSEQSIDSYLFSYAVDAEVSFFKDEAAHLVTVFFVCYMTGRFLSIFIRSFFPIHYLIFGSILGGMACAAAFAFSSSLALWCIAGFAGLFMSPLYPSGMAWINVYMKPNSLVIMMVMFASSSGTFLYKYLLGWLFDQYGVRCLMFLMIQCSLTLLFLHIAMHVMGRLLGPRFHMQQKATVHNEAGVSPSRTKQQDKIGDSDTEVPLNDKTTSKASSQSEPLSHSKGNTSV